MTRQQPQTSAAKRGLDAIAILLLLAALAFGAAYLGACLGEWAFAFIDWLQGGAARQPAPTAEEYLAALAREMLDALRR